MADNVEDFGLFTAGDIVGVKTSLDETCEGEVMAFDYQSKVLFIKCEGKAGREKYHDVRIINLDFVEYVVTRKEVTVPVKGAHSLLQLKIQKVKARAFYFVKKRENLVQAMESGISRTGVQVFLAITKTIPIVDFKGKDIVVMNRVIIKPPYRPENCRTTGAGKNSDKSIIKKILKDHFDDQAIAQFSESQQAQSGPSLPKAK